MTMWPFKKKQRIILTDFTYGSYYEALLKYGIQENFPAIQDHRERSRQIKLFEEFRLKAFEGHVKTLSKKEQQSFQSRTHPSQSHSFMEEAQLILTDLREELKVFSFVNEVKTGLYHGNRIVFSILLTNDCEFEECYKKLPWLYRGFETKVR